MKITCPKCRRLIPAEDVNVSTDIAVCRSCQVIYSPAELPEQETTVPRMLTNPPSGAWFRRCKDGLETGATLRSTRTLLIILLVCACVGLGLGGIYGSKYGLSLETITGAAPLAAGVLLIVGTVVMLAFGKILVRSQGDEGVVFTGIGSIGRRRHFKWTDVSSVYISEYSNGGGGAASQITLEGKQCLNFGFIIREDRLEFMLAALREMRRKHRRK